MRAALLLALCACIAGCAVDGRQLDRWQLDVEARAHGEVVTLPSTLLRQLPFRETDFVLRTTVALDPTERGHELTLVFDCFHGPLTASVAGEKLDDHGDTGVGEHVFILPARDTSGSDVEITIAARRDSRSAVFGFGAAPRLTTGPPSRAPARFDRYLAIVEIMVIVVLGLVFGAQYIFDRRRVADGAFAIQAFAALGTAFWQLGWLAPLGVLAMPVLFTSLTIVVIAMLLFLHHAFGFEPFPRRFVIAYGASNALGIVGATSFRLEAAAWCSFLVLAIPLNAYILPRLFRLSLRGDKKVEARLILGAAVIAVIANIVLGAALPVAGWHLEAAGILSYGVAQALILSHQQVMRSREVERANVELQHQVAARSKDLADALAKLAKKARTDGTPDQVVDGRYRVVRRLGAGGMGSVDEVVRISDGEHLALKRLRGRADPDVLARFAREAQIAAELRHQNLVPVIDVGVDGNELFLVMPLVDGGSLENARARFGKDIAWARKLLSQIAAGLAALHQRGIVHRDLKPGNILIAAGVARIADFGLAYFGDAPAFAKTLQQGALPDVDDTVTGKLGRAGVTRAGDVFGTPHYMAPELAGGVHAAAPASDIFAFGIIAFELAMGRAPFTVAPVLRAFAGAPYAPPDTDAVDATLRPLVDQCLAAEPSARPTAEDIVARLR